MSFSINLDTYRGPLDLLLYLVKKHEVEITDIPIALITDQYFSYLEILQSLDVNAVGDFIEMASTLIELKSKQVLPQDEEEEPEDQIDDPRDELVERLLEYKKYKDAASVLEEQSISWQQRYPRMTNDLPPRKLDPADQPIQELELWDLVSAFGRMIKDQHAAQPANIVYDDTPLHVYMEQLHAQVSKRGEAYFSEMFQPGMHKSAMVGVFLAILELTRHHGVRTEQTNMHGEIRVIPGESFQQAIDLSNVDTYDGANMKNVELPVKMR